MTGCTPEDVLSMADYFGVNTEPGSIEYHLLPIVREAVVCPVPSPWKEYHDPQGQPYFLNTKTFEVSGKHPHDENFLRRLIKSRRRGPATDTELQTWMKFDRNGTIFFYNFATGERTDSCPEISKVLPEHVELAFTKRDPRAAAIGRSNVEATVKLPDPDNIRFLRFKSWWSEDAESCECGSGQYADGGLAKRYVLVNFDCEERTFSLEMRNNGEVLKFSGVKSVTAKNGAPLECWDLHVGAKLDIMGKTVTLLQASMETSLWIDNHKRKLLRMRTDLEEVIKKYRFSPLTNAIIFTKGSARPGGTSLRGLIDQITALARRVGEYRPSIAMTYKKQLEKLGCA